MNSHTLNPIQGLSSYIVSDVLAGDHSKQTESASLAHAEREIKALREENLELKRDIAEIRSAYKQLITENNHENYDERRVNFLKAQMIQLERQILILNEALSSRSSILLNVENSLATIADRCRHYLSQDSKIGEVAIAKSDLHQLVETAESARMRLYKNIENTNPENVEKPVVMLDKFLQPKTHKPVTLLDICSGSLEHINLKHVAKLESKLSQLYKQLMLVSQTLHLIVKSDELQFQKEKVMFESANQDKSKVISSNQEKAKFLSSNQEKATKTLSSEDGCNQIADLPKCLYARLGTQVTKACNMLKGTTLELLALSILIPSAPWPPLRKPFLKDLTTESVMSKMTGISRSKQTATRNVVDSLLKAMNYNCHMANVETRALKEEVAFHQKIYHLQTEYLDNLWRALRCGYEEFQREADKMICQPMKEILSSYDILQRTASEDALKCFLKVFKEHFVQITEAVRNLSLHLEEKQGEEAISAFGEHFFQSLSKLKVEQQHKRDASLDELDVARQQYNNYTDEIRKMFPENQPDDSYHSDPGRIQTPICLPENTGKEELQKAEQKAMKLEKIEVGCHNSSPDGSKGRSHEEDGVKCICGVESDESGKTSHREKIGHVDPEQNIVVRNDDARSFLDKTTDEQIKPSVVSRRRPPRMMKGVAPSKLVLCRKSQNDNSVRLSVNHQVDQFEHQADIRSAQSLSDISQGLGDGSHDNRQPMRKRSGSLSRSVQRITRPSHLEPLISPLMSVRMDHSPPSSKPWK